MMAVTASFFLILSGVLWIVVFNFFKKIINDFINSIKVMIAELLSETRRQNDMLHDISEGLRPETQLRIKTISNAFFDLAAYRVMAFIKRVKKENHIDDKEKTRNKITKWVSNLHADRNSKFDCFLCRGKRMSEYVNPEWVQTVADVVEREVYDAEPNDDRSFTNVRNAYDEIKLDFYRRLNKQ